MEIRIFNPILLGKTSIAIVLPQDFVLQNHIEKGKKILLKIDYLTKIVDNLVLCQCRECDYSFSHDNSLGPAYCPACDSDSIVEIPEEELE